LEANACGVRIRELCISRFENLFSVDSRKSLFYRIRPRLEPGVSMKTKKLILLPLVSFLAASSAVWAGSLQPLTHQPPVAVGMAFLLTDGSVMFQGSSFSDWWKLAPDQTGSYVNGIWTQLASIPAPWTYAPYAFASAVLADGRVLIEGGEYNENGPFSLSSQGAIYDPVHDSWTPVQPPTDWSYIGDSSSLVLPNGKFLLGDKLTTRIAELDPVTLTWTAMGSTGKADFNAEEGWTLLPDGSILAVDVKNTPDTERYLYVDMPGQGRWISQGSTPQALAWNYHLAPIAYAGGMYVPPGETGPCLLRPDGTVFCAGASDDKPVDIAHTAIFTPQTTMWAAGPDFPAGDDAGDTSAVLLPSGNVLISATSGSLYEFDGTRLNPGPSGGGVGTLLLLPTGEAILSANSVQVYTPATGIGNASWAPTITQWPSTVARQGSYSIAGTQFNGLSQAQAFGDELQSPTNYPLVRIANNATGHVFYARTHDHSTMGVATGAAIVSTKFDVPLGAETGASTLSVVANGIASAPVNVVVADAGSTFAIGPGITGNWYDTRQSGHGFSIEVLPGNELIAEWYVFAPNGGQSWIVANGPITGNTAVLQGYQPVGPGARFPPNFNSSQLQNQPWGTITFTFTDCNNGQVSWLPTAQGYPSGSIPITRLTMPAGLICQ
jgi:hypothetical protein